MADIINILNEKKFFNASKTNLRIPLSLDSGKRLKIEDTKFHNISLTELYYNERSASQNYAVYGKISPLFNFETIDPIAPKPNDNSFNLKVKNNWNLLLLRPSSIETTVLEFLNENSIDFANGLPLIPIEPVTINDITRIGFRSIFKHDFKVGDFINITDPTGYVGNKMYGIVYVYDDIFLIDKPYTAATSTDVKLPSLSSLKQAQELDLSLLQKVKVNTVSSGINTITVLDAANEIDLSNIKYEIFAKKIDGGIEHKYYIKTLRAVDVCDDFDILGFSKTQFGQNVFEFTFPNQANGSDIDNMGYPIDKLYLGLIKSSISPNLTLSHVTSKLLSQRYSESVNDDLEVISYSSTYSSNFHIKGLNDTFLYGLVSYNYDQLTEELINPIEHFFTINPNGDKLKFSYNPFTELRIKQKSSYIETSDKQLGSPDYAYYNKKKELYCWRDTYSPGTFDLDGNGLDLPFLNGAHYVYCDISLNLKNYNSPKYAVGYNAAIVDYSNYSDTIRKLMTEFQDDGLTTNNTSLTPDANAC